MDFHRLITTGDLNDEELALLEGWPDGFPRGKAYCLMRGSPAAPHWPEDARIQLREENPGIKLCSLLGNTGRCLVVASALKDAIVAGAGGVEIEALPFTLLDHRGRVASRDYWFVNPIGKVPCLDEQASGVVRGEEGSVVRVKRFVLDAAKIGGLPAIFRVDLDPTVYVVRDDLAQALVAGGFTNVTLKKLDVKG